MITPEFKPIPGLGDGVTQFVFQLIACTPDGSHFDPAGTAVVIGPYIALTAKHVIEDYEKQFGQDFALLAFMTDPDGRSAARFKVARVSLCSYTDIAVLRIVPDSDEGARYEFRRLVLDLELPKIGTAVAAFGYYDTKAHVEGDRVSIQREAAFSWGTVVEVYPQARDRFLYPFPCIRMNVEVRGGMSGGPVFTEHGRVCGLANSSMPLEDGHEGFATLFYPVVGAVLDFPRQGYPPGGEYTMHDLMAQNVLSAHGLERTQLVWDDSGERVTAVRYRHAPDTP